ncbi:hypothetical protein [Nocardioides sp. Leaf285]|uniref:hypothetical protein n=1 Tax=Nocardioides sp. Leaf285 TaxID=1736322 RepID=UPI0007033577|nr:hypothetical protein [Nocardioides sp. Leaf285]KQP63049.1 hypothetical protein ASF47_18735 [Nocardioides sp. Leaf285]
MTSHHDPQATEPTTDQRPQQRSSPGWEWRPASGHESQPLAEWWVEQAVVKVVAVIARRAHRRGDTRTFQRMLAVSLAGADAEKAAARSDQDDHA